MVKQLIMFQNLFKILKNKYSNKNFLRSDFSKDFYDDLSFVNIQKKNQI